MSRFFFRYWLWLAAAAMTTSGCRGCQNKASPNSPTKPQACTTAKDCGGSDICDAATNTCKAACSGDADCASNESCVSGVCQNLTAQTQTCVQDSDCTAGLTCQNLVCKPPITIAVCQTCVAGPGDADGDCEPDAMEALIGTDPNNPDTDGDHIPDGCEDRNHNGIVDQFPPELDPTKFDTDGDGIGDGIEDANHNGDYDPSLGETDGTNPDTDADGISDGDEDRNHDGIWNCSIKNPDNSFTVVPGDPCEMNPRTADTDGDGLPDSVELRSAIDPTIYLPGGDQPDSHCNAYGKPLVTIADVVTPPAGTVAHAWNLVGHTAGRYYGKDGVSGVNPATGVSDDQTCPWNADSDEDGIPDGNENLSATGVVELGETDPRLADSDGDGVPDGLEDANHNGLYDLATETNPTLADTDGDGILDGIEDSGGCVITHVPGSQIFECTDPGAPAPKGQACNCANWENGTHEANESDPRTIDTDGDGIDDGIEDANGDGYCSLALDHTAPKPSDESCAWSDHSDSDTLADGAEDINGNGKRDPGETDPRYGDPDNDCLDDAYEVSGALDPFNPDTDGDNLADGLEALHLQYNAGTATCDLVTGGYGTTTCTDPHIKDSDGDGLVDGFEVVAGVTLGEDLNADGKVDGVGESNPCDANSPGVPQFQPIVNGGSGVPGVCVDTGNCAAYNSGTGAIGTDSNVAGTPFPTGSAETNAYNNSLELVCTDGSIKPIIAIKSSVNDYTLALPAVRDENHQTQPLYTTQELDFGGNPIGTDFISNDSLSSVQQSPFRAVFGSLVRMGTIVTSTTLGVCDQVTDSPPILDTILPAQAASGTCAPPQNYVVPNSQPLPSDVAERTQGRLVVTLAALGYTFDRTAGGDFFAHDDQSTTGLPNAITVQGATDSFVVRRSGGGQVDPADIKRGTLAALTGGNQITNTLTPAAGYATGEVAILSIEYYRRLVKLRQQDPSGPVGATTLVDATEYGAIFAVSPVDRDCSELSGAARTSCKIDEEEADIPTADLTNGSAVGRFDAIFGTGCEPFDPAKSKADFLVVIDDSVSMQGYILAIQAAARDVSSRLTANQDNMDWRIGMTTSNMGRDDDQRGLSALNDPYVYGGTYPELAASGAPANLGANDGVALYQTSAYAADGTPQRCHYLPAYDVTDPLGSPYCCSDTTDTNDGTFVVDCCQVASVPAPYSGQVNLSGTVDSTHTANNTLRCYDYPRYDATGDVWHVPNYSPDGATPAHQANFLDYLCGNGDFYGNTYSFTNIWGARGHLWPPGFVGPDASTTHPQVDGANLLIRNADMLVAQMNRPCAFNKYTPRSIHGSQFEHPLQATKRAIERAITAGGGIRPPSGTATAMQLRQDAPMFSIVLSDEDDYALKYLNNGSALPTRDQNELPVARCYSNPSDSGCTVDYCEGCFENVSGQSYVEGTAAVPSYSLRIPAARVYNGGGVAVPNTALGNYCQSPKTSTSTVNISSSPRYDGFYELYKTDTGADTNGLLPDDDTVVQNQYSDPNSVAHDWLNINNAAPVTCNAICGADCQPCMRFLREKQYTDFFSGQCSPPLGSTDAQDPRKYPLPYLTLPSGGGTIQLPLGKNYAITRKAGFQGGTPGSCGSTYVGGDGLAHRDISLATGGRVADICLADTFNPATGAGGFTDFLDEIVVDAQGVGSPYRLQGDPISSTIQVGVIAKDGNLYLLKRSSVSGFDYNPTSRSIAFFTEGLKPSDAGYFADDINRVNNWVKVLISYRVWDRQCPEECALGDICGVCSCSAASPECCTFPKPTYECRSPTGCLTPCGACQTCDTVTNTCRAVDPCAKGDPNFQGCGSSPTVPGATPQCDRTTGTCIACAAGTTPVVIPCGTGCTEPQQYVCVSQAGIPSGSGATCRSDGTATDCCGSAHPCTGTDVCVLEGCTAGQESCTPLAHCEAPSTACGTCPTGTGCAPLPCANPNGEDSTPPQASCPAQFACTSDGNSAQCAGTQQCGCPNGQFCNDCGPCKTCNNGQCQFIAQCSGGGEGETVAACGQTAPAQCCPANDVFDPTSQTCVPSDGCNPACPEGQFCAAGRCFPNGG